MGNSKYYQFLFSKNAMLTFLEGDVTIGASGAVSSYSGAGISSVVKLATGLYQLNLTESFNKIVGVEFLSESPVSGSAVTAGSFVTNQLYQITTLGTTNWNAIGLPTGVTAAVGQPFVATGVGSGTGTAKAIGYSGIQNYEVAQDIQSQLYASSTGGSILVFQTYSTGVASFTATTTSTSPTLTVVSSEVGLAVGQSLSGAGIPLGTVISAIPTATTITMSQNATASASLVPITASPAQLLVSPASGTIIRFNLMLRNSSVTY